MPTEKVSRILKSRGVPEADISAMTEQQAWDRVYATEPPKREKRLEVCFTGFTDGEKAELVKAAKAVGLAVVTKVTVGLFMLCTGGAPGVAKIKQAQAQGTRVVSRSQLEAFISTGEIPS